MKPPQETVFRLFYAEQDDKGVDVTLSDAFSLHVSIAIPARKVIVATGDTGMRIHSTFVFTPYTSYFVFLGEAQTKSSLQALAGGAVRASLNLPDMTDRQRMQIGKWAMNVIEKNQSLIAKRLDDFISPFRQLVSLMDESENQSERVKKVFDTIPNSLLAWMSVEDSAERIATTSVHLIRTQHPLLLRLLSPEDTVDGCSLFGQYHVSVGIPYSSIPHQQSTAFLTDLHLPKATRLASYRPTPYTSVSVYHVPVDDWNPCVFTAQLTHPHEQQSDITLTTDCYTLPTDAFYLYRRGHPLREVLQEKLVLP